MLGEGLRSFQVNLDSYRYCKTLAMHPYNKLKLQIEQHNVLQTVEARFTDDDQLKALLDRVQALKDI